MSNDAETNRHKLLASEKKKLGVIDAPNPAAATSQA
jgi:hypothetical protein